VLHSKEIKQVATRITGAKTETEGFQGEKLLSGPMEPMLKLHLVGPRES